MIKQSKNRSSNREREKAQRTESERAREIRKEECEREILRVGGGREERGFVSVC